MADVNLDIIHSQPVPPSSSEEEVEQVNEYPTDIQRLAFTNEWQNSFCGCFSDPAVCVAAFLCCYPVAGLLHDEQTYRGGENGEREPSYCNDNCYVPLLIDLMGGLGLLLCMQGPGTWVTARYKIKESEGERCVKSLFCPCSMAQAVRELKAHGDWNGGCCTGRAKAPRETKLHPDQLKMGTSCGITSYKSEQKRMMEMIEKLQQAQERSEEALARIEDHLHIPRPPPRPVPMGEPSAFPSSSSDNRAAASNPALPNLEGAVGFYNN